MAPVDLGDITCLVTVKIPQAGANGAVDQHQVLPLPVRADGEDPNWPALLVHRVLFVHADVKGHQILGQHLPLSEATDAAEALPL